MILKINPDNPARPALDRSAEVISKGGLVVAPTETRYGLLARADSQDIVEKLYRAKQRDLSRPTALLVRNAGEADLLGYFNDAASILAEHFLPGPLTLVLKSRKDWPSPRVVDGKIGLRWSSAKTIEQLLSCFEFVITATSANSSGHADHNRVEEIADDLGDSVDLYLDAGPLSGKTSTVVDCSGPQVRWLRDGAIDRADIENVVGKVYV